MENYICNLLNWYCLALFTLTIIKVKAAEQGLFTTSSTCSSFRPFSSLMSWCQVKSKTTRWHTHREGKSNYHKRILDAEKQEQAQSCLHGDDASTKPLIQFLVKFGMFWKKLACFPSGQSNLLPLPVRRVNQPQELMHEINNLGCFSHHDVNHFISQDIFKSAHF